MTTASNTGARSALETGLISDILRLTPDEQQAVRFVLDRILIVGRASYAPWRAEDDDRDIDKEIADECADALVYSGMRAVMRHNARRTRLECELADRVVASFECVDGEVQEVLR